MAVTTTTSVMTLKLVAVATEAAVETVAVMSPAVEILAPIALAGGILLPTAAAVGVGVGIFKGVKWLKNQFEDEAEPENNAKKNEEKKDKETKKCIMSENGYESDSDNEYPDNPERDDEEDSDDEKKKKNPKCVSRYDDQFSSETTDMLITGEVLKRNDPEIKGALTGSYHLVRRLTRYMRLAGMATYISNKTGIPKTDVFNAGPSLTKDHTCNIENHNACHVVRVQQSRKIIMKNIAIGNILRVFLGHTHCVHYKFNKCIGKQIDTVQGTMLNTLLSIEWETETGSELSNDTKKKLIIIKEAWLNLLSTAAPIKYLGNQPEQLNEASKFIRAMSFEYLFEKILVGYAYISHEMGDTGLTNFSAYSNDITKKLAKKIENKPKLLKSNKMHSNNTFSFDSEF